jgi:hypothetical protein
MPVDPVRSHLIPPKQPEGDPLSRGQTDGGSRGANTTSTSENILNFPAPKPPIIPIWEPSPTFPIPEPDPDDPWTGVFNPAPGDPPDPDGPPDPDDGDPPDDGDRGSGSGSSGGGGDSGGGGGPIGDDLPGHEDD